MDQHVLEKKIIVVISALTDLHAHIKRIEMSLCKVI